MLSVVGASAAGTAEANLYAPAAIVVVDVDSTVRLLAQTGELAPLVIRRLPSTTDEVLVRLKESFGRTREHFLRRLQEDYGTQVLGSSEVVSGRFKTFCDDFQTGNPQMPLNLVLAQLWAKGYSGTTSLDRLSDIMRQVLDNRLIGLVRPASTVFLATPAALSPMRNWGEVAGHATPVEQSEIHSVQDTGLELRRRLDALDRGAGGFLSGLLRPNVMEDDHLTALLLRERLGARAVTRRYAEKEMIATAGMPVDRAGELALAHLKRIGLTPALVGAAAEAIVAKQQTPAMITDLSARPSKWFGWRTKLIIFAVAALLLFLLLRRLFRPRHRPVPRDERLATVDDRLGEGMRAAFLPHLAREMTSKLVRALYVQRGSLIKNAEMADQRVTDLETRLAKIQPAIAARIRAYEDRIRYLERQLEEKDRRYEELIRSKLALARKERDAEIARNQLDWR